MTKVIICRTSMYHIPDPDLKKHGADFCCIGELLKKDFLEKAVTTGTFSNLESGALLMEYDRIRSALCNSYYGVIYAFGGTVNEFLRSFSAIGMMNMNIKRCPICEECFVSPPMEWYKHILGHAIDEKGRLRKKSFDYYFGPE